MCDYFPPGNSTKDNFSSQQSELTEESDKATETTDNDEILMSQKLQKRTRPVRNIRKPVRYMSSDNAPCESSSTEQTDTNYYKIKRILAQRCRKGKQEYLVHYKPAQNALWTPADQLNQAALQAIKKRPPPVVD